MRYLMMSKGQGTEPDENLYAEMAAFIEELSASGVLLATGGLDPVGFKLANEGGQITVIDGPFTEAKEAVGGFALIEVRSRDEAIELGRRFMAIVGEGESFVHEVFGP